MASLHIRGWTTGHVCGQHRSLCHVAMAYHDFEVTVFDRVDLHDRDHAHGESLPLLTGMHTLNSVEIFPFL